MRWNSTWRFVLCVNKVDNQSPAWLLETLSIPSHLWEIMSMVFIVALTKSEGCDTIIVVVDQFSKYVTFIAAPKDYSAEETTNLFFMHMMKYWGLPRSIMNDRDTRFTGKFWSRLFKLMRYALHFSISIHPQLDGQTSRVKAFWFYTWDIYPWINDKCHNPNRSLYPNFPISRESLICINHQAIKVDKFSRASLYVDLFSIVLSHSEDFYLEDLWR